MIYFDHAAADFILPEIRQNYPFWLEKYSGNIEAAHQLGHRLRKEYEQLAAELVKTLFPNRHLTDFAVFAAGDSSSLLECLGRICHDSRSGVVWASDLDHASLRAMVKRHWKKIYDFPLSSCGKLLPMNGNTPPPNLAIITHIQSEIGVKQDLAAVLPPLRQACSSGLILLDAVQSAAHLAYHNAWPLPDLLLISGAKLGSGSGAALIALNGCCQFMRQGFERLRKVEHLIGKNDPLQLQVLLCALQHHQLHRQQDAAAISELNRFLRSELEDMLLPNGRKIILTVPAAEAADNILHFILPGYQSGVLVRMFSEHGLLLSAGSACEAETAQPSRILSSLNYKRDLAYSGLRISLSAANTRSEAETFLQLLNQLLKNY